MTLPVTRLEEADCWSIDLGDRKVRVTDSWLMELGVTIEQFVEFYESKGYWPWKPKPVAGDMTIADLYGF